MKTVTLLDKFQLVSHPLTIVIIPQMQQPHPASELKRDLIRLQAEIDFSLDKIVNQDNLPTIKRVAGQARSLIATAQLPESDVTKTIKQKALLSLEDVQLMVDAYQPKVNKVEDEISRLEINSTVYSAIESFLQAIT